MMFQPCSGCGAADSVHDDGPYKETCTCEECGAQFEIEPSADLDGDDSTVGERID